jgi:hypothetical protein
MTKYIIILCLMLSGCAASNDTQRDNPNCDTYGCNGGDATG